MTFKIENISESVVQPNILEYHWIKYQAELYRPYIAKIPKNTFRTIIEYDQKKDKSCVIFAALANIWYNWNLPFNDDEGREIWLEHQWGLWGDIFKTSRELGQRFILNTFPIYLDTPEWEMYLDKGWSGVVEIWSDTVFLQEWVQTGKITKIAWSITNKFKHGMELYKKDGRYLLQNSWRGIKEEYWLHNIYDITEVYEECIKKGILRPYGMAILPYFSHITEQPTTLKDHTRAITRLGLSTAWDVWDTFKKKFAKVDGVIDKK